jgi:hypothetical protein
MHGDLQRVGKGRICENNIVMCFSDNRWVLGWMIGFIAPYTFTTLDDRQL